MPATATTVNHELQEMADEALKIARSPSEWVAELENDLGQIANKNTKAKGRAPVWTKHGEHALERISKTQLGNEARILRHLLDEATVVEMGHLVHPEMMRHAGEGKLPKYVKHQQHLERAKAKDPTSFEKDYERIRAKHGKSKAHHEELLKKSSNKEKGRHNPANLERPLLTSALPTGKHLMKRRSAQIMSTERRECGCSWWDVPCAASCAWEAAQQAAAWIAEQAHTAAVALAEATRVAADMAAEALREVGNALSDAWETIKDSLEAAFNWIKEKIVAACESAGNAITFVANGVKEAANNAAAAMHQLADDAANALEVIGNYLVEKGKQMLAAGLDTLKKMLAKVVEKWNDPTSLTTLLPDLFFTEVGATLTIAGASTSRLVDLSSRSIASFYAFQLTPGDLLQPGASVSAGVGMGWSGSNKAKGVTAAGTGYSQCMGGSVDLADLTVLVGIPPFLDLEIGVTVCCGTKGDIEAVFTDFNWEGESPLGVARVLEVVEMVTKAMTDFGPDPLATKTLDFSLSAGVSFDIIPGGDVSWTIDRAFYMPGSGHCFADNMDFLFYMWIDPLIQPFAIKLLITALSFVHYQKNDLNQDVTIVKDGKCNAEAEADFVVAEGVSFVTIGMDLLEMIGLDGESSLENEHNLERQVDNHGVVFSEMEKWADHEWESHIEMQVLGLEKKNADQLSPYKFMMVDETAIIQKTEAELCLLHAWDTKEDKDAYWKADCLHKPHVTKALSKDHLPAETMTIGIGADAVEVKEHTFWGKLIGWRFKSAEALTKAVDKDFGFVAQIMKGMGDGLQPLKGFEGLVFTINEKTFDCHILTMWDTEWDLKSDSNGIQVQDFVSQFPGSLYNGTVYSTTGQVKIYTNTDSKTQDIARRTSGVSQPITKHTEGAEGEVAKKEARAALWITKSEGVTVQSEWKASDEEKNGAEAPSMEMGVKTLINRAAAKAASGGEDHIATLVMSNPELERTWYANLYTNDKADDLVAANEPIINSVMEKLTDRHIVEKSSFILITDEDGLGHGPESSIMSSILGYM